MGDGCESASRTEEFDRQTEIAVITTARIHSRLRGTNIDTVNVGPASVVAALSHHAANEILGSPLPSAPLRLVRPVDRDMGRDWGDPSGRGGIHL